MAITNYKNGYDGIKISFFLYSFLKNALISIDKRFAGVIPLENNVGSKIKLIKTEAEPGKYVQYECHYDKQDFIDNEVKDDILLFFKREKTTNFDLKDCISTFIKNNKTNEFSVKGLIVLDSNTKKILYYKIMDDNVSFLVDDESSKLELDLINTDESIEIVKKKLGIIKDSANKNNTTTSTTSTSLSSINEKEKEIIDKGMEFVV